MYFASLICLTNSVAGMFVSVSIPASAREVIAESVDGRIAGKDPTRSLAMLLNYPSSGASGIYRRNPDFWGREIDFSCVSVWNSAGRNCRAGTVISPWHVIFAAHFPLWKGVRITFLSTDGTPVSCEIAATKRIGNTDLMVASLNASLPPSVVPAKLLPEGYQKFIHQAEGLPVVTFNQRKEAIVGDMIGMSNMPGRHRAFATYPRKRPNRMTFNRDIIVGDSGSPAFLIHERQPILVYLIQADKAGSGDSPHMVRKELEAVMQELHSGVGPDYVDFSRYAPITKCP